MSRRRFLPTDAFVDESIRGQRYWMGCVLVEARALTEVRAEVAGLVTRSGRIHFHNESDAERADLLGIFAQLPIEAFVVTAQRQHGTSLPKARAVCLKAIVAELQARSVGRLVIESRQDDREDVATVTRARTRRPTLVFEHRMGPEEPMLWIADGVTWAAGAGARWRSLIEPILSGWDKVVP
jgi:hypothetical protein